MVGTSQSSGKPGDLICLCIGGRLFVTRRATLYRLPDSRLYLIATQGSSNQESNINYTNQLNISDDFVKSMNDNNSEMASKYLSQSQTSGRLIGNGPNDGALIGGASILPDNIASMVAGNMNLQSASSICRNRGSGFTNPIVNPSHGIDLYQSSSNNPVSLLSPKSTNQFTQLSNAPIMKTPPIVYFYDRDPEIFRFVLDYYRTGELHLPSSICGPFVRKELIFWGIDEALIGPCCMPAYMRYDEEKRTKNTLFRDCFEDIDSMQNLVKFSRGWKKWRYRMWLFMDHPSSSLAAKIWASVLLVLMIASVMCYCLSTHDVFRTKSTIMLSTELEQNSNSNNNIYNNNNNEENNLMTKQFHTDQKTSYQTFLSTTTNTLNTITSKDKQFNTTFNNPISICYDSLWHPNPKIQKDCSTEPSEGLVTFDISLNCLFTIEFLLKVLLAPDKPKFLTSIVSVFDMVILSSYWVYMSLFYYYYYYPKTTMTNNVELKIELSGYLWLLNILSMTQALRILRIFKISKISRGLRVLILTVKKSIPELVLLGFLLMNGMFLFSSMMYIAEYRVNDTFPDIPQSFWWSIITLTAVGYGDMHPKGGAGYFVGSLTAISGCIVTGLAIPIVGNNFNTYYKYMKNQLMEDKYLKTLRKDMEATGGVSGTKSGLGVAAEKGGLPLPGRKPRNINRRIIRGSKISKNDTMKSSLVNMMEICTRSIKRLLPTGLINKNNCKPIGVPKTQTTDSMQLLTENQKLPNVFTRKATIHELNERKNSYKNQNNMSSNNLMSCKKKLSNDKLDIEHRPSLMYPLATDQFLNSLLPSQLSLIPTPQIWVDGEEFDDQLSAASHVFDNNNNSNSNNNNINTIKSSQSICSTPGIETTETIQNHPDHHYIYSRMSIVSEEILPNSIQISSDIPCCTVLNVSDVIQNDDNIMSSAEDGDDEQEDSSWEAKTMKSTSKIHMNCEINTIPRKSPSITMSTLKNNNNEDSNYSKKDNNNNNTDNKKLKKPIAKRMNYV
ncbi:hypothetical protein MS3_00007738 [Schistosoma haematobium]|uniref:Voltage-gated potassium channel n=2 Tax=Schistosoma haematobium TaxID=6185 RepID=A0A922LGK1_SCHHA|nr:hypothetical protein MS3_00007738 [Schistosoma haematobium]KAH9583293.1 hypothetical protein MS3_00007738 [Schistosoma haematobium]CAH8589899.1 unnamed protein product [Schistosoma haematobium]